MTISKYPSDQLQEIASTYRHLKGEHRREGEEGSWRRQLEQQLETLERRFETILNQWMSPEDRRCWQSYLYNGGVVPQDDLQRVPPVFVGRSHLGSLVEVRENHQSNYEVVVDGAQVQRLPGNFQFGDTPYTTMNLVDQEWTEISQADDSSLQVLQHYVESPEEKLPWQVSRILFNDGLIDLTFGLTPRGRRILAQYGNSQSGEVYFSPSVY